MAYTIPLCACYTVSGTDIAYAVWLLCGARTPPIRRPPTGPPSRLLRWLVRSPTCLRASHRISRTRLLARYDNSGTDLQDASSTDLAAICLHDCYRMSGTDVASGALYVGLSYMSDWLIHVAV
eukprot:3334694-Rhodomonas_salina.1